MENKSVKCGRLSISNDSPFTLIAGPCQLENEKHAIDVAIELKKITEKLDIGLIYKTSFDKANRTSLKGKRGAGLEKSLPVFDKIRKEVGKGGYVSKNNPRKPQSAADKAKVRAHQAKVDKENAAARAKDPSQGRYPKG